MPGSTHRPLRGGEVTRSEQATGVGQVATGLPGHTHRPLGGDALKARRGGSLIYC